MSHSEEWEAQQEANKLLAQYQGADSEESDSEKYKTYQPPVYETQGRNVAEYLIVKGFTFLRAEPLGGGGWSYVFASRGEEPAKTARLLAEGKLSFEESARMEAGRTQAQEKIRAAIAEFTRQQNLRAG